MSITELTTTEVLPYKVGEEIHVALKSAGSIVAVDARVMVTPDAPPKMVRRGGRWTEAPAYCGPTKAGLWLRSSREAFQVAEAIAHAAGILFELERRFDGDLADVPTDELARTVARIIDPTAGESELAQAQNIIKGEDYERMEVAS